MGPCSLDYAGPEILRGERYYGKEQDVWAFGVVAYVMLVGECPFTTAAEAQDGLESPFANASIALDERCMEGKEKEGEEAVSLVCHRVNVRSFKVRLIGQQTRQNNGTSTASQAASQRFSRTSAKNPVRTEQQHYTCTCRTHTLWAFEWSRWCGSCYVSCPPTHLLLLLLRSICHFKHR